MSSASNNRPSALFKYRPWLPQVEQLSDGTFASVNYTEDIFRKGRFYCQGPRDFDDPHDSNTGPVPTGSDMDVDRFLNERMSLVVPFIKKYGLSSLTQLEKVNDLAVAKALNHYAGQSARRDYRILCLSAVGNSELLWSFYADNHRGVCLEFDGADRCFDDLEEVQYTERPSEIIDSEPLSFRKGALAKSSAWKHQSEWRLFSKAEFWSFPKEAMRSVILGYRFPESAFDSLVEALIAGKFEVKIYQMQRRLDSYLYVPVNRGAIARSSFQPTKPN